MFKVKELALLAALIGPVFSSLAWVTEQEAVIRLSPITVCAVSPILASLILFPFVALKSGFPSLEKIKKCWKPLASFILFRNIITFLLSAYALSLTSSAKVMFLTKMEPYLVALVFWLVYREKMRRYHLFLLFVHISGAILLSTGGGFSFNPEQLGDILIFIAVIINALLYLPTQKLASELGSTATTCISQAVSGAVLLPFCLYFYPGHFNIQGEIATGWIYMFITVLLFYVLSTSLWIFSLTGVQAWLSSALRSIGPVVAAPVAWVVFDRPLDGVQITGALVVIATSVMLVRDHRRMD